MVVFTSLPDTYKLNIEILGVNGFKHVEHILLICTPKKDTHVKIKHFMLGITIINKMLMFCAKAQYQTSIIKMNEHRSKDVTSDNADGIYNLSLRMKNPTICICDNKDADQLCSNCTADQCLCFRHTDSTIPLVIISKVSSF